MSKFKVCNGKKYVPPIFIKDKRKKVDLVFMIDGTEKMTLFIDALGNIFKGIVTANNSYHNDIKFRYGAVVYRDKIITSKQETETDKLIWIDLNECSEKVDSMFRIMKKCGGGNDGAEDWASGYQCLLDKIHWDEDATKIVVHVCTSPGHGNTFTGKRGFIENYITIPSFSKLNTDSMNKMIYDEIQYKQDGYFRGLIRKVADKKISFFCVNGNEFSMQCFNRTRSLFVSHDADLKFIIKNEFGYTFKPNLYCNEIQKSLERKLSYLIKSGIDVLIAYNFDLEKNGSGKISEYEKELNEEFLCQLNQYETSYLAKSLPNTNSINIGKYIVDESNELHESESRYRENWFATVNNDLIENKNKENVKDNIEEKINDNIEEKVNENNEEKVNKNTVEIVNEEKIDEIINDIDDDDDEWNTALFCNHKNIDTNESDDEEEWNTAFLYKSINKFDLYDYSDDDF